MQMFNERIKTHHSAMGSGNEYLIGRTSLLEILNKKNENPDKKAVIYIHVPFCNKICTFCSLRRSLRKPDEDYADTLIEEIKKYASYPYIKTTVFDAVYFGGGTPTTLSGESLSAIIKALKENFKFTEDAEFTIETTVTELSDEKIDMLVKAGANRFSVGVQTFNNKGRQQMGRVGTGEEAYAKLKTLKKYKNITVSMDLIYNYAEQTLEDLREDLNKILSLDLDSFSMYSLMNTGKSTIAEAQDEKNDEKMFFEIAEYMKKSGYEFLELTKMVKRDSYKYIMNRHKAADTLPLGAGAGGSLNSLMCMNPIKLEEYKQSVQEFNSRCGMLFKKEYDEVIKFKGDIQTGKLPKEDGYKDRENYELFKNELLKEDMIVKKDKSYYLTQKGIFWGNTISRKLSAMI